MTRSDKPANRPGATRIAVWLLAAGTGIYMVVSGIGGALMVP
ncbi:hypothetical protein [Microbacterium sp.]